MANEGKELTVAVHQSRAKGRANGKMKRESGLSDPGVQSCMGKEEAHKLSWLHGNLFLLRNCGSA